MRFRNGCPRSLAGAKLTAGAPMNSFSGKPVVFLKSYGCQMNKLDSNVIMSLLAERGCAFTDSAEEADVILFNTCTVRQHAVDKAYSRIGQLRHLKEMKPDLIIGVLGCMAQSEKGEILKRMPFVDLVCGTGRIYDLPEMIDEVITSGGPIISDEIQDLTGKVRPTTLTESPFHAYISIMRGCDNFCSYCIVPYVRGREHSRAPRAIVDETKALADKGIRQITLLGQNIDSYGKNSAGKWSLAKLLGDLEKIEGISRIKFVTSNPKDFTDDILYAMRDLSKVCEYLHLPIQSGSDRILRAMRRGYTTGKYLNIIEKARRIVPSIAVSSDFIVGFPGETEEDFEASRNIMKKVRFKNCFIFKYSPRRGTPAAKLSDDIPIEVKKARNCELLEIQNAISLEDNKRFIGKTFEVLVEGPSKRDASKLTGRTRTDYIVAFNGKEDLAGRSVNVKIKSATALTLFGECICADE